VAFEFRSQFRRAIPFLVCLTLVLIPFAQGEPLQDEAKKALTLKTIGHGKTADGHVFAFRDYSSDDGTMGRVIYTDFDSLQAAQRQIEEWIKTENIITGREQHEENSGQPISDRVLAEWKSPTEPVATVFVIIRRDSLNCYLITSSSMEVAKRIEQTIQHSPGKIPSQH
jgi:hypothetical protein